MRPFAYGVLGLNVLVVLWGAFVRASGSGAGCGAHWPTCNGEIVPRAESVETAIELTHRAEDRMIFARGALHAARWAGGQKPGLYSMTDVLGLKDF